MKGKRVIMAIGILILAGGCESATAPAPVTEQEEEQVHQTKCEQMLDALAWLPGGFWLGFDAKIQETVKQECEA